MLSLNRQEITEPEVTSDLENLSPEAVLQWALDAFSPKVALACSFLAEKNCIRANNVPFNRLHKQGYLSIGCAPCSRAVTPGEDLCAGRWWWENPETKECGLHMRGAGEGI